ncbi:hypothetical protein QI349_02750 [Staphylococcus saprophyticus]|nr:hypothetical protein [Staphylococcus saprophyticus]
MKLIKTIGLLSGLSVVAYFIVSTIQEIVVVYEANDDIDMQDLEDVIFKQREMERGKHNG